MIICFIGTVGSGKTLGMTREAHNYFRRGHTVYTNYGVTFPHVTLDSKRFQKMIEEREELQNCVICLDEVHVWIDSRTSMKKRQRMMTYFILQTRKRNVRLLVTTQHFDQIDKRLRNSVDILVFCKNLSNKSSLVVNDGYTVLEQVSMEQYGLNPPLRQVYIANRYYQLFDTSEIIDFLGED